MYYDHQFKNDKLFEQNTLLFFILRDTSQIFSNSNE
jgi:hypothetical protein